MTRSDVIRGVGAVVASTVWFAVPLFLGAGTLRWPAGWAFLILNFCGTVAICAMLLRHDPALLAERLKPPMQKGQPLWDKVFVPFIILAWMGWLVLIGLDAVRLHWSDLPLWSQAAGAVVILLSGVFLYRVYWENAFLSAVIRVQTDRGHTVVSTGPYAIIRHPMYAGAMLYLPAVALMLGSWYGVLAALVLDAGLVFRTVMEDRFLQRGLEGYAEYAAKVRYRLIPHVW